MRTSQWLPGGREFCREVPDTGPGESEDGPREGIKVRRVLVWEGPGHSGSPCKDLGFALKAIWPLGGLELKWLMELKWPQGHFQHRWGSYLGPQGCPSSMWEPWTFEPTCGQDSSLWNQSPQTPSWARVLPTGSAKVQELKGPLYLEELQPHSSNWELSPCIAPFPRLCCGKGLGPGWGGQGHGSENAPCGPASLWTWVAGWGWAWADITKFQV